MRLCVLRDMQRKPIEEQQRIPRRSQPLLELSKATEVEGGKADPGGTPRNRVNWSLRHRLFQGSHGMERTKKSLSDASLRLPEIVSGEIDVLPAERCEMSQQESLLYRDQRVTPDSSSSRRPIGS